MLKMTLYFWELGICPRVLIYQNRVIYGKSLATTILNKIKWVPCSQHYLNGVFFTLFFFFFGMSVFFTHDAYIKFFIGQILFTI